MDEAPITGVSDHRALDLEGIPHGAPILAPASGRAWFSYQNVTSDFEHSRDGRTGTIGLGGGLFVEIQHRIGDEQVPIVTTQYIHLATVAPGIRYFPPVQVGDHDWAPSGVLKTADELWELGTPVEAGQVIGTHGDTGIGWGWHDAFDPATGQVAPRDRRAEPPWDPVQTHWQAYQDRDPDAGFSKRGFMDITGLYAQVLLDYNPYGKPGHLQTGPRTLLLTDSRGRPQFAG